MNNLFLSIEWFIWFELKSAAVRFIETWLGLSAHEWLADGELFESVVLFSKLFDALNRLVIIMPLELEFDKWETFELLLITYCRSTSRLF